MECLYRCEDGDKIAGIDVHLAISFCGSAGQELAEKDRRGRKNGRDRLQ